MIYSMDKQTNNIESANNSAAEHPAKPEESAEAVTATGTEPTAPTAQKDDIVVSKDPHINLGGDVIDTNSSMATSPKPNKPKSKAWLIVLIVVVAILVIGGVSIVFVLTTVNKKKEPDKTLSKSLSSLENSYKDKTVSLTFPASPQGWTAEVFGDNGIYKYKYNSNTCQITFQQNKGVNQAINSGLTLDSEITSVIDGTAKQLTKNDLRVGSAGTHSYTTSDGKQVDFVTKQVTYTGNDGVPYTLEVAGQWIGNYEFVVLSACSTSDWAKSNKIINNFLSQVKLTIY